MRATSSNRARVMAIINVTPDSFYSSSRCESPEQVVCRARAAVAAGADILDVGACSTRPGSDVVSEAEELRRLDVALRSIREVLPDAYVSVDTFRASVARHCVERYGVRMVNDISGGDFDEQMWPTVHDLGVTYVVTHTSGLPAVMQHRTAYGDVTAEVLQVLARKVDALHQLGVCDVCADPGFGFGKTVEQNFRLLRDLEVFAALDAPLLVGLSRKSMICKPLGCSPDEALNGTTALNVIALMKGAAILRVHDVKEAFQAVKLAHLTQNA